jgi:uncharacterized membrane protein
MEQTRRDGAYNPLRRKIGEDDRWAPRLSPGRLEALTDGVFAIAMTLIAIELGPRTLWDPKHRIEFYSYGLGFFSLGIFWIFHHYMFYFIKRSDGTLVWMNILFLAAASLVPFWTNIVNAEEAYAEAHSNAFGTYLGSVYYGIYMVFTFMVLIGIWYYATSGYRLVNRDIDKRSISDLYMVMIVGAFIVALVTIGMYFIPPVGNLLWIAAVWFIVSTIYARHRLFERRRSRIR